MTSFIVLILLSVLAAASDLYANIMPVIRRQLLLLYLILINKKDAANCRTENEKSTIKGGNVANPISVYRK